MMNKVGELLKVLVSVERDEAGKALVKRDDLPELMDMVLAEINDSIELAETRGWVNCESTLGSILEKGPTVEITAEGRLWLESAPD